MVILINVLKEVVLWSRNLTHLADFVSCFRKMTFKASTLHKIMCQGEYFLQRGNMAEICYPGNSLQSEQNQIMLLLAADKALRSYKTLPTLHKMIMVIDTYFAYLKCCRSQPGDAYTIFHNPLT